ncbi:helicase ARIP4-like isoform X1 [Takifugu flavidus]|uniref:helicase ARIP4-like isoform X1 n=1 Tax=Takifugu flavidus TaxID=433684 RepID=UPI002544AF9F|nr:helicase ARIP4-like isoform X1 [Takifugu flavidus]
MSGVEQEMTEAGGIYDSGGDEEATSDQSHSAPFSSENGAQGGDSDAWQCTPPQSTSPSGETPAHPPPSQPGSRPRSRPASQSPSPPSALTGTKKRSTKPAHIRRNIRKLLREHQLEAVTKAAQQDELERRRRLEQQRKQDFPTPALTKYKTGDVAKRASSSSATQQEARLAGQEVVCLNSSSEEQSKAAAPSSAPRQHKTDVICLSSSEDDPLASRGPTRGEGSEKSKRSGTHTDDAFNRPDAQGRVLVNLNHPSEEKDIFLLPQLARAIKPHQIGGIRFLYDNLIESVENFGNSSGFGCILAHSMGLGKTLQVISFIDILFRHTRAHTVLAIVPVNTLQNWLSEFNTWVPAPETLPPDTDPGLVAPRAFKVHILNDEHKNTATRAKVVEEWARDGGVLLMGYEMYRLLSLKKNYVAGRKKKNKKATGPVVINVDEEDRQQELLKGIEKALARPGPDVVICDEGHRIKNCHASTSHALKKIQTRRRVVLTGYPLQNNLIEYWCMVDFVRPDFLGTRQEFSNMFERPILNGQCVDSTPEDVQLMRYRSHVLHSLLEGFVQRRGHDVLRDQLPSKQEHVILVRLSPLQRALYTEFMNRFKEAGNTGWLSLNPLKAFSVCCKIWNHPDVLFEALQKENLAGDQDLDLDDITTTAPTRCLSTPNQKPKPPENPHPIGGLSLNQLQEKANQVITYEWAKEIMSDYKPGVLENSAKMVLLFHLIEESVRKGDKLLVFSQSLSTLTVIEDFLAKRPVPPSPKKDKPNQTWVRNINYYRLDGSTTVSERERLINQFNDPSNTSAWLFLLSTRAGCLGVNLIGANRVVVFDASWNPCHDAQAVCRVYRYGQRKPCHIYRLVCDFTLEKKIYDRQISKQGMSDRVVDDLNPVLTFTRREVESLLHFVEEVPDPSQVQLQPQEGLESVLRKALHFYPQLITKQPFPHESLLIDCKELKLSKDEKKAAKKGYEEEKRASVPYTRPSYAHYYPASDQSLTNIPAFSQRNWRPSPRAEEKSIGSVRPVPSAPVPMMPSQASSGSAPRDTSDASSLGGFPVHCLQKAGVFVQKIVTTTDLVIPGSNSSTDVQARITAGESIHIIRGTKGTYIRTSDGRIFAVRAANKPKPAEENAASFPAKTFQAPAEESAKVDNGLLSPERKQQQPSDILPRPLSPDSPEIISELQRYTGVAGGPGDQTQNGTPSENQVQPNGGGNVNHHDASVTSVVQPNMDAAVAQDLRIGSKRKASSPPPEEHPSKQHAAGKHSSASMASQGFPFSGGYGLPPLGINPSVLGGSLGLFMGAGAPYLQSPHTHPGESGYIYPDLFGFGGAGAVPASSSSTTTATLSTASSTSTVSAPGAMPPYMLRPNMAAMAAMLPPGFPLSYSQSLAGLYAGSMLPGGLPGTAASPGLSGASYVSQYPPTSAPSSCSSSPSSFSSSARSEGHRAPVLVNGRNISSGCSSEDEGDVTKVRGE